MTYLTDAPSPTEAAQADFRLFSRQAQPFRSKRRAQLLELQREMTRRMFALERRPVQEAARAHAHAEFVHDRITEIFEFLDDRIADRSEQAKQAAWNARPLKTVAQHLAERDLKPATCEQCGWTGPWDEVETGHSPHFDGALQCCPQCNAGESF
jgi:hypothetical protein